MKLLSKSGVKSTLRITHEIKLGIFDEKRSIAALFIKNSRFYFIFNPNLFISVSSKIV